jgi:hypothetical protein
LDKRGFIHAVTDRAALAELLLNEKVSSELEVSLCCASYPI